MTLERIVTTFVIFIALTVPAYADDISKVSSISLKTSGAVSADFVAPKVTRFNANCAARGAKPYTSINIEFKAGSKEVKVNMMLREQLKPAQTGKFRLNLLGITFINDADSLDFSLDNYGSGSAELEISEHDSNVTNPELKGTVRQKGLAAPEDPAKTIDVELAFELKFAC